MRRVGRQVAFHAAEQRADGREDLAELVVQLARELLLQVFLHAQHPPRQRAELGRQPLDSLEGALVGADDRDAADAPTTRSSTMTSTHDLALDALVDLAVR